MGSAHPKRARTKGIGPKVTSTPGGRNSGGNKGGPSQGDGNAQVGISRGKRRAQGGFSQGKGVAPGKRFQGKGFQGKRNLRGNKSVSGDAVPVSETRLETEQAGERLQKVLAAAGIGSRRYCESLISEGRVEIDRQTVTELGVRVLPSQQIRVDGEPIRNPKRFYYAVHKPPGVVSTSRDQWQRTRVIDLVDTTERLFTIGRLDKESSGLILVTNDGELAHQMTHPRYGIEKTYRVTVAGNPSLEVVQQLRKGVYLAEGPARPRSVVVHKRLKQSTILEIILTEGKNREIRRMLARVGHKVLRLQRISIGPIRLGMLEVGESRPLEFHELKALTQVERSRKRSPRTARTESRPANKLAPQGDSRSIADVLDADDEREDEREDVGLDTFSSDETTKGVNEEGEDEILISYVEGGRQGRVLGADEEHTELGE